MKITRTIKAEQDIRYLRATMGVRYWVDCQYSEDNGNSWNLTRQRTYQHLRNDFRRSHPERQAFLLRQRRDRGQCESGSQCTCG